MDTLITYLLRSLKEEEIYKSNQIQHLESYILRLITLAHLTHSDLTVTDLLQNKDLGSAPTIHRYIRQLLNKGLATHVQKNTDSRIKYVIPSEKAILLFTELSRSSQT